MKEDIILEKGENTMTLAIKAFNIKSKEEFNLVFFVEESEKEDIIFIKTEFNREEISVSEEFHFTALQEIRKKLHSKDLDLKCYGALENAHPSPMMMFTTKAYLLEEGKHARNKDIVDIFDYVDVKESISVEKQELFFEKWLNYDGEKI